MSRRIVRRLRPGSRPWCEQSISRVAEKILALEPPGSEEVDLCTEYNRSQFVLGRYVTLDYEHAAGIRDATDRIAAYAEDYTRLRPLNILMLAESGSGKSHLVKALAEQVSVWDSEAVAYNMAALQRLEDLSQPLEAVRNLKVLDKFPVLFLDEVDARPEFLSVLLPLLWDGEVHIGHADLKLGKVVIVLAASTQEFRDIRKKSKNMEPPGDAGTAPGPEAPSKFVDLLSRINGGVIEIPPLDLTRGKRDRRVDKICIALSLLESRFGGLLHLIPWAVLHFIGLAAFRYGVRSIAHLIDLLPALEEEQNRIRLADVSLPFDNEKQLRNSSLAYHLAAREGPEEIVELWGESAKYARLVRIQPKPEDDMD